MEQRGKNSSLCLAILFKQSKLFPIFFPSEFSLPFHCGCSSQINNVKTKKRLPSVDVVPFYLSVAMHISCASNNPYAFLSARFQSASLNPINAMKRKKTIESVRETQGWPTSQGLRRGAEDRAEKRKFREFSLTGGNLILFAVFSGMHKISNQPWPIYILVRIHTIALNGKKYGKTNAAWRMWANTSKYHIPLPC